MRWVLRFANSSPRRCSQERSSVCSVLRSASFSVRSWRSAGLAAFGADLGAGYFRGVAPQLDVSVVEYAMFFLLGVGAALSRRLRRRARLHPCQLRRR